MTQASRLSTLIPQLHWTPQYARARIISSVTEDSLVNFTKGLCFINHLWCTAVSLLGLKDFGRLKFVQNTWAGVDGLAKKVTGNNINIKWKLIFWCHLNILTEEGLSPRLRVARHQHPKFGQIMAEYSLAAVINMERNMANMIRNQINCDWNKRQI